MNTAVIKTSLLELCSWFTIVKKLGNHNRTRTYNHLVRKRTLNQNSCVMLSWKYWVCWESQDYKVLKN